MVYESDFYTTRRPYSSRPNVSSYSVTVSAKAKNDIRFSVVTFLSLQLLFLFYSIQMKFFLEKFLKCCGCWCLTKTILFLDHEI